MKKLLSLLLFAVLASPFFAAAAPAAKNTLATENDPAKIQELLLTTNYENMTENEYISIKKHLGDIVRAADISTDKGKKEIVICLFAVMNIDTFVTQGKLQNITKEKIQKDVDASLNNIKSAKKEDLAGAINMLFPTDNAKLKQGFQTDLTARANYRKSILPTPENLIAAVQSGNASTVKELIKAKVNVNIKDKNSIAPLITAATFGYTEIVKLLIDAKADVNVKDNDNNTALIIAAGADNNNQGRNDIVKLLLDAKAKVNEKNNYGSSALIGAAYQGNVDVLKMLITAKADLTIKDSSDNTALKTALDNSRTEAAEVLKKAGAK